MVGGACEPTMSLFQRSNPYIGPVPPAVGEALLVSISSGEREPALWRWSPREPPPGSVSADLRETLRSRMLDLQRLATHDLPVLRRTSTTQPTWSATLLHPARCTSALLDGRSFSASMLIAHASWLMNVAPSSDLAASADVDAFSLELQFVDAIVEKVRCVAGQAPFVRRFAVAAEQANEARSAGTRLQIVACRSMRELFDHAFPNASRIEWTNRGEAERAARDLFAIALHGRRTFLSWRCVHSAARAAYEFLPLGAEKTKAARAWAIAARHEGKLTAEVPPFTWPDAEELASLPAPLRFEIFAHVVQHASDSGDEELPRVVDYALEHLPPRRERCAEALKLCGAIGRAQARMRDYPGAEQTLSQAVHDWDEALHFREAGPAAAELARVYGVLRDALGLTRLRAFLDEHGRREQLDFVSQSFVDAAIGRALVQAGSARAALQLFESICADVPDHLKRSCVRWRARALRSVGLPTQAEALEQKLEADAPADWQTYLVQLDRAVEQGGDASGPLEKLAPRLAYLRGLPAAVVRDEFPY